MKWSWKHKATSQSGFSDDYLVGRSVGQLVGQSVSQLVSQSVSQSVSSSVSQLVSQSFGLSVGQSVRQSIGQSVSLSVSWSVSWSVSQSFIYLVRQSFHAAMLMISKNVTDLTNQLSFPLQAMINTNYLAGVYTSHSVVKRMKERRKGHIVFVSSIGGQVLILIELCTFLLFFLSALQLNFHSDWIIWSSLCSRRLEVVGERENGCAWGRHARLACLLLAHPFFLVPTTCSKRLLRRLHLKVFSHSIF